MTTFVGETYERTVVTAENIEDIREQINYSDQEEEIVIGETITTYGFLYEPGQQRGQTTIYHDSGRAAIGLGGDSTWGDYDEATEIITTDEQDDEGNPIRYTVTGDTVDQEKKA